MNVELIDRYLTGECTPEEVARLRAAADVDPRLREVLAALPEATRNTDATWDLEAAWDRWKGKAASSRRPIPWIRLAAILVVGVALTILGRRFDSSNSRTGSVASQSYSAAAGTPREVRLADGSSVTVAPHSTLTVPAKFPESGREVYLDGEAFFQVTHDARRPYIVRARDSQTRVLGTSFNVSAYADAANLEVVVVTGSVQLSAAASRTNRVLAPGELGKLDAAGAITVEKVDVDAYTNWREGLSFRAVRFDSALPRLERWFGVNIEIADPTLASKRLTAFFDHQALPDVLDAIAAALNARYQRNDTAIVFYSN